MSVKDSKKAAKQVGMIDREMTVRPVLNRLVLNHRAEHFACFWEVHRCRCIRFMEEKEAVNGQRSVNFGVRDPECIEGGLERVYVAQYPFCGHVKVMKMGGLGFSKESLHVQQTDHLPIGLEHPVANTSRNTCR